MSERSPEEILDPVEGAEERPGSDPGVAYDRAVDEDQFEEEQPPAHGPGVDDTHRSGP